jgi:hypothetical protein
MFWGDDDQDGDDGDGNPLRCQEGVVEEARRLEEAREEARRLDEAPVPPTLLLRCGLSIPVELGARTAWLELRMMYDENEVDRMYDEERVELQNRRSGSDEERGGRDEDDDDYGAMLISSCSDDDDVYEEAEARRLEEARQEAMRNNPWLALAVTCMESPPSYFDSYRVTTEVKSEGLEQKNPAPHTERGERLWPPPPPPRTEREERELEDMID